MATKLCSCLHCGQEFEAKSTGRPPSYCSGACRTAGNRYGNPCPRSHRLPAGARKSCVHPPPSPRSYW